MESLRGVGVGRSGCGAEGEAELWSVVSVLMDGPEAASFLLRSVTSSLTAECGSTRLRPRR